MMQPADLRDGNHLAAFGRFDATRNGRVALKRKMSSRFVVVGEIRFENASEVTFVDYDDSVETLATDGSDQALDERVLPWRSRRFLFGKGLDDLLGCSLGRWMCGNIEVHNASTIVTEDNEGEQNAKRRRGHREEVKGDDIVEMVVQERTPSL